MSLRRINPPGVAGPFGRYSHAIAVPAGARLIFISGQIGADAEGRVPADAGEQATNVFRNLLEILKAEGLGAQDIVKLTMFLVAGVDVEKVRAARQAVLGAVEPPASTLIHVSALAAPEWLVEIEAIAAAT